MGPEVVRLSLYRLSGAGHANELKNKSGVGAAGEAKGSPGSPGSQNDRNSFENESAEILFVTPMSFICLLYLAKARIWPWKYALCIPEILNRLGSASDDVR